MEKLGRKPARKRNITGWLFNTPYVVYSLIFLIIPIIWAAWLSLTDWNLMTPTYNFVGLKNFKLLFSDKKVQAAFINSFRYMVPIVLFCVAFGVGIALLTSLLPEKLKGTAAVLFFIPYLTSGVATSVMVKHVFGYNSALNIFLRDRFDLNINWLQSKAGFWILVSMVIWKMSGYYALFILSAIESVPEDIYEASQIDGCVGFQKFIYITLPMIIPAITSIVVLATGLSFQIYSEPFLLTGGGPSLSTTTWQLEIYNSSFVSFNAGYGASMAIANAIQIFITLQVITWIMDRVNHKFGW